ncbi:MAG TPA: acetate kinase [Bryobacteraceae bacterium]|nr:acetate kinase [Bryobacteraceae bacterium]
MKILVLNCGSSSLKFQIIETTPELSAANRDRPIARGEVSRIGNRDGKISFQAAGRDKVEQARAVPTHDAALAAGFECLTESGIARLEEIEAVGHRIVHGADFFQHSVVMNAEVVRLIESCSELAPLHNPHNLRGYYASRQLLPQAANVAVFDTAFHHTIPPRAYLYGIPYEYYTRYKIRRYGFHGTSFRYVSHRFAQIQGKPRESIKTIVCHLGNGASICAIDGGKSVDTSMGFTPLEGLLMGTRPGDLDAGVLTHLMRSEGKNPVEMDALLNERCGLLGISGLSNDMQELLAAAARGEKRAEEAIAIFCYRATKYIGAYVAALNGTGSVIFTGGIGENAPSIRARICEPLGALGIKLDPEQNAAAVGHEAQIGAHGCCPAVWVIPTNEELLIARDTMNAVLKLPLE